ncbi:hypothetical protein GCM10007301_32840 [Azorhizobium oxalatiphilum]|uniref:Uncharacterized protein n=1 Tax=Azorhizobium oxalatiphilum TaxID=980631 RepID=A0A917FEM6_9HYPH|nr:hypothetical protein [Azorhizobium oxalatiphilum]GGF70524.1 hypothetical protein GCM10007301_32840 [Azorhizobium oxalatiphilum]
MSADDVRIDTPMPADLLDRTEQQARDVTTGWSLGVFGAVAEFVRGPDEPAHIGRTAAHLEVATGRGALRLQTRPGVRWVDYTTPSRHAERRQRGIALCLPDAQARLSVCTGLRALGPDTAAVRAQDRGGELFDIGLGTPTLDACIRITDPALADRLKSAEGESLFARPDLFGAIAAAGPHRVFCSALGRIEVFQPIPPPDGRSPDGPHTHLLPKLLAHGRGHAANLPIPDGLAVCFSLHPAGPPMDGHEQVL